MSTSKLQRYTGKELRRRFAKYGIVENTRPDWLISSKGERLDCAPGQAGDIKE